MTPSMKGFTLVETLVYLGLFSIAIGGLIVSAFYLIDAGADNQKLVSVQEEGTFLNRKLAWAIASATDADVVGGTTLTLSRPDLGAESPLSLTYDAGVGKGSLMLSRGGGIPLPLNGSEFTVTDVVFSVVHEIGRPTYVGATYKVEGESFRLDIYLRE